MKKYTFTTMAAALVSFACAPVFATDSRGGEPRLPEGVSDLVNTFSKTYDAGKKAFRPINDAALDNFWLPLAEAQRAAQKRFDKATMKAGAAAGNVVRRTVKGTVKAGNQVLTAVPTPTPKKPL